MSNRFVVDFGDLKLDDAAKRRISNAIQAAALGQLASLDNITSQPFAVYDPIRIRDPRWYGIWFRNLADIGAVPGLEQGIKEIQQFAAGH